MTALIVLAVIVAVFAVILTIPVTFGAQLVYDTRMERYIYAKYGVITLFPRKRRERPKPEPEPKPDGEEPKEGQKRDVLAIAKILWSVRDDIKDTVYAVVGYMFKHLITVRRLDTVFCIGLDDAMKTALAYGGVSGFMYTVLGVMDNNMKLARHYEDYQPDFNKKRIYAEIRCILKTNLFHAAVLLIITLCHALPILFKVKHNAQKGGDENVKSH